MTSTLGTVTGLTAGTTYQIRVLARNSLGFGLPSSTVSLIPAILPLAPTTITLTAYGPNYLTISWSVPTNTGTGGTTTTITNYMLEVNENFGTTGFVSLSEQSTTTFTHQNLIMGH